MRCTILSYTKPIVLLFVAALLPAGAAQTQSQGWGDTFESYRPGPFPFPAGGWQYAHGNSAISVDNTTAGGGKQSLKLFGLVRMCWGALAAHHVDPKNQGYAADFTLELMFRNGTEGLSGCHPHRAKLQLNELPSWRGRLSHVVFVTTANGSLQLADGKTHGQPLRLLTWHRMKVRYTRMPNNTVRFIYHVNGKLLATVTVPAASNETRALWMLFESSEGTAWFDEIRVRPSSAAQVRVDGNVTMRQHTRAPLPVSNADVEVLQRARQIASAKTNNAGHYSVLLPPTATPGAYTIRATLHFPKPGFHPPVTNYHYPNPRQDPVLNPDKDLVNLGAGINSGIDINVPKPVVLVHGFLFGTVESWREAETLLRLHPAQKSARGIAHRAYVAWSVSYGSWAKHSFRSHQQNAASLRTEIAKLRTTWTGFAPDAQIDLVAHSMGGLVARAYLHHYAWRNEVDRLFTFGTPHAGVFRLFLLAPLGPPPSWPLALQQMHPYYMLFNFHRTVTDAKGARLILLGCSRDYDILEGFPDWPWDDSVVATFSALYPFLAPLPKSPVIRAYLTPDRHAELHSNTPNGTLTRYLLRDLEYVR